jgi:phosphohistidine phosphatase
MPYINEGNMIIHFLRHGDALTHSQLHDSERPLSELGKKQAELVALFLHRMNVPLNLILTSPLKRAHETGAIIQSHLHAPRFETTEYLVNGSNPKQLFQYAADCDIESLLLVGHEPFLSDTISLLLSSERLVDITMRKCSVACVEIENIQRPGTGRLVYLLPVEALSKNMQP